MMISSTTQPKNVKDLGNQISKKSTLTPYEVIEVFSKSDMTKLKTQFERFIRNNGHFSVIFVGESK